MKVSELERGLWIGDVIIGEYEYPNSIGYIEFIVTGMRFPWEPPVDQNDPNDFAFILIDDNSERVYIKDASTLADWEYSHTAFKFGAYRELKQGHEYPLDKEPSDVSPYTKAAEILLQRAKAIKQQEDENASWGGPDPRGYDARGIELEKAKLLIELANEITNLEVNIISL